MVRHSGRGRGENDVPISDATVIALQVDRPRQFFMAVESSPRDARYFLVVDNRLAVFCDRHVAASEGGFAPLPTVVARLRLAPRCLPPGSDCAGKAGARTAWCRELLGQQTGNDRDEAVV